MALINGMYIHVKSEELERQNEISSHSVEREIDFTDTVKRGAAVLSLSGLIVDYAVGGETDENRASVLNGVQISGGISYSAETKAYAVIAKLKELQDSGALVTYLGRNICRNMQIKMLKTSHPNTVAGGAEFEMELKECRLVSNAYIEESRDIKDGGTQQIEKGENAAVYHEVKKGDTVYNLVAVSGSPYFTLKRDGAIDRQSAIWF